MTDWIGGPLTAAHSATSLGGPGMDGVLPERIVVPASCVIHLPGAMSFEDAAALPCAGFTAWSALFEGALFSRAKRSFCWGRAGCRSSRSNWPKGLCDRHHDLKLG